MSFVHDKLRLNSRPSTYKLEKNIDKMVPIEYAGHRPRMLHSSTDLTVSSRTKVSFRFVKTLSSFLFLLMLRVLTIHGTIRGLQLRTFS